MAFVGELVTSGTGALNFLSHPAGTTAAGAVLARQNVLDGRVPLGFSNGGSGSGGCCSSRSKTEYTSLAPPSGCGSTASDSGSKSTRVMCHTPRDDDVTESVQVIDGVRVMTCYPGSPFYKPDPSKPPIPAKSTSASSSARSSGGCAGGSCRRRAAPTPPVSRPPARSVPPPPATSATPASAVGGAVPPSNSKNVSPALICVCVLGGRREVRAVRGAMRYSFNNFSGADPSVFKLFRIDVAATDDPDLLRQALKRGEKIDVLVARNDRCNDLLEVCAQTGYNGSLLLIGGATAGVIRADLTVPKNVASVILTHGFGAGPIISEDDFNSIVDGTDAWIYANEHDDGSPSSILNPHQVNRACPYPYALELVRALKFSHDAARDWNDIKLLLINKLGYDNLNVAIDPWT
jgi:hypothetical protein